MVVTFVLRLVADQLRDGAFAGEVHVIASGERKTVRSGDDLLAVLRASSGGAPSSPAPPRLLRSVSSEPVRKEPLQ